MRSRLHPLLSLATATLLLAVTSPLPIAATPLGNRNTREDANADQEEKAKLLSRQGTQQYRNRQYQEALKTYQQVLAIRRKLGDKAGVAHALHNIGTIYYHLGQTKQSLNFLTEALAIRREIGDEAGEARTLNNSYAVRGIPDGRQMNAGRDERQRNDVLGDENSSGQVSLLFEDDEKQATPRPRYTPPNVAYPSGDREAMPGVMRDNYPGGATR